MNAQEISWQRRIGWRSLMALLFAVAVLSAMLRQAYADGYEVFAEHIEDYFPATASVDLPGCADTTARLVTEFEDADSTWTRTWYADEWAWESDWKKTSLAGGADANYAGARDFGYFCGHGAVGWVQFTTNNTDQSLFHTNTSFGDNVDLEWVTFDTSNTLQSNGANLDTWYLNAFQKLHLLIGWHDSPLDTDTGGEFADRLINRSGLDGGGDTITTAWFANNGGCTGQNNGTTQTILAELVIFYDDHVWGEGSVPDDSTNNGIYWIWQNDC